MGIRFVSSYDWLLWLSTGLRLADQLRFVYPYDALLKITPNQQQRADYSNLLIILRFFSLFLLLREGWDKTEHVNNILEVIFCGIKLTLLCDSHFCKNQTAPARKRLHLQNEGYLQIIKREQCHFVYLPFFFPAFWHENTPITIDIWFSYIIGVLHNLMEAQWWRDEATEMHVCKLSMCLDNIMPVI